jgi:5-methylcytosine-specific restriction endonuclease McrA
VAGAVKRKKYVKRTIKKKTIKKFNRKTFLIANFRRISYKYYYRNECLRQARVAPNLYQCAHCGDSFPRTGVQVDHVTPVIDPIKGFTNWDDYVNRMFPESVTAFAVLCKEVCHKTKTQIENQIRKASKNKDE